MRLIDAEALRALLFRRAMNDPTATVTIAAESLDDVFGMAPTVSCKACRHVEIGKGAEWCLYNEFATPSDDFGCSDFERRQP